MGCVSRLLELHARLLEIDDPVVDRSLSAAVPTAEASEVRPLARVLLDRGSEPDIAALIVNLDRLPADLQTELVVRADRMHRAMRAAATDADPRGPSSVLEVIRRAVLTPTAHPGRLAYLAADILRHGPGSLRPRAAATLLEVASAAATRPSGPEGTPPITRPTGDGHEDEHLTRAVLEAVRTYDVHRQPDSVTALFMLAPRNLSRAAALLERGPSRARLSEEVLARLKGPLPDAPLRRALLWLISLRDLSDPACRAIARLTLRGGEGELLDLAHLVLAPRVRRALAGIKDAPSLVPAAVELEALPAPRLRNMVMWIQALPMEPSLRVEMLARLAAAPDAMTRLSALRAMIRTDILPEAGDVCPLIAAFCHDPQPGIARIALRHLIARRWIGLPRLLPSLINSAHDDIRQIAGQQLGPIGFARFWEAWPRLNWPQRLAAGRALIKIDPAFHRQISERIAPRTKATRLRGLAIIHGLNQGSLFEPALVRLARDPDRVIASAAVRALGSAQSPVAVEALESALEHPDSRVRANAVESLDELRSTRHVGKLIRMAEREANRPRANAIKSLMNMRTREAMVALSKMLHDTDPAQRTSALWVVETLGLAQLARQVAELAVADADGKVKDRAGHVIQRLIGSLDPRQDAPAAAASSASTPAALSAASAPSASASIPATSSGSPVPAASATGSPLPHGSAADLLPWCPLLARAWEESARWDMLPEISKSVRGGAPMSTAWLLVVGAVLLVVLLLAWSLRSRRERKTESTPARTFHRIAADLGVSLSDQWLLVRIARRRQLVSPLALLVSTGTLRHHARAYAAELSPARGRSVLEQAEALARWLEGPMDPPAA